MIAQTVTVFSWHDGTLTVSGWGLLIIFSLILAIFAFAERDRL